MRNFEQNGGAEGHVRSGVVIQALSWSKRWIFSNGRRTLMKRMAAVAQRESCGSGVCSQEPMAGLSATTTSWFGQNQVGGRKNKSLFVTGGGKGIGAAVSRALPAEAAIPVIADRDVGDANAVPS